MTIQSEQASSLSTSVLTPDAVAFITELHTRFNARRLDLLSERTRRQAQLDGGGTYEFPGETQSIRTGDWQVAGVPGDLADRRVEITGPADDRKMVINALNSDAYTFMADFEDSCSPTWTNVLQGQVNLRDAVNATITFDDPVTKKHYSLKNEPAVLIVRPRGWHLYEKHLSVGTESISASLFDFGLYLFHNAQNLMQNGSGPYFYLPKLENHLEARLWNDVFVTAQEMLSIPRGTIKATVLIETLPAAFEMHEILYELRDHSAGLNCGRWDYIFSFIKKFRNRAGCILPDRSQVTMSRHFLNSYVELLIQTCHRRGAHAMGGMAAQIPIKNDTAANESALARVLEDKLREVTAGHDGTWVAHPGLVNTALQAFNRVKGPNQIENLRNDVTVTAVDLQETPTGTVTEIGFLNNINVGIQYLEAWLSGRGAVPINHLMEDAATAEICRAQLWQWLHHASTLTSGQTIDRQYFQDGLETTLTDIRDEVGTNVFEHGRYQQAADLISGMVINDEFEEFLTLPAYHLLEQDQESEKDTPN